ncbi:hypothetical protein [Candidatus Nitrosopumilus sediminis]|uniref:hypothetical protein n=1 Tax=Candidatus Nitrosopumilus sediminis TaxID=1229909 RepID=UPI00036B9C61|nr:hypothetical protein [Candidatus Nitrosopumilus sediminis]
MEGKITDSSTNSTIIPWIVFLFSISIVLISFISVIFPALILASDTVRIPGIQPITPDPFETGVWSGGVIITSIIIFSLAILHHKKKIPALSKLFEKIFSFEISKKTSLIVLVILLTIYIISSAGELATQENLEDYVGVKNRLETWSVDKITSFEPHVRYALLSASMNLFGSYKIIPFLASIALLITTYLITTKITNKRFAGIISTIILLQSSVFLTYDTTVSYTNFWILFYLASLYAVYRFWPLSPVAYMLSILSKALTVAFLPMSIYFILRSQIPRKQKIIVSSITAGMILAGGLAATGSLSPTQGTEEAFDAKEFQMGLTSFAYQLRSDGAVMLFMIPLMVGLFIVSRKGVKHGESMMVFISGMLLVAPILTGFTTQTNQPYRFVPLVVFFAMGVGVLLSKRQPN